MTNSKPQTTTQSYKAIYLDTCLPCYFQGFSQDKGIVICTIIDNTTIWKEAIDGLMNDWEQDDNYYWTSRDIECPTSQVVKSCLEAMLQPNSLDKVVCDIADSSDSDVSDCSYVYVAICPVKD